MAQEGGYSETLGVLIIVGACFAGGVRTSETLSGILYAAGVGVLLLWIAKYILEGAAESV